MGIHRLCGELTTVNSASRGNSKGKIDRHEIGYWASSHLGLHGIHVCPEGAGQKQNCLIKNKRGS
jgi:hypothetical protein